MLRFVAVPSYRIMTRPAKRDFIDVYGRLYSVVYTSSWNCQKLAAEQPLAIAANLLTRFVWICFLRANITFSVVTRKATADYPTRKVFTTNWHERNLNNLHAHTTIPQMRVNHAILHTQTVTRDKESRAKCLVFYKFCGLLVSRKENICISLVLVALFYGHHYPLPPIGVGSIYL